MTDSNRKIVSNAQMNLQFTELPAEIITQVLINLGAEDIIAISLTNHHLHNIVQNSAILRFLIAAKRYAIHIPGSLLSSTLGGLSLDESLMYLQRREENWLYGRFSPIALNFSKIRSDLQAEPGDRLNYRVVDDLLVIIVQKARVLLSRQHDLLYVKLPRCDHTVLDHELSLVKFPDSQLPAPRHLHDLPLSKVILYKDLLIVISPRSNDVTEHRLNISATRLSTGESDPCFIPPGTFIDLDKPTHLITETTTELMGSYIILLLRYFDPRGSDLHLINWKTGAIFKNVYNSINYLDFGRISRDIFVLPDLAFGILVFGKMNGNESESPVSWLASLGLPEINGLNGIDDIRLKTGMDSDFHCLHDPFLIQGQSYLSEIEDAIIAFDVDATDRLGDSLGCTLVTHRRTLIKLLESSKNFHFLWKEWGPPICAWIATDGQHEIYGQRLVDTEFNEPGGLCIFDFNQNTVRLEMSLGDVRGEEGYINLRPGSRLIIRSREAYLSRMFKDPEDATAYMPYIMTAFPNPALQFSIGSDWLIYTKDTEDRLPDPSICCVAPLDPNCSRCLLERHERLAEQPSTEGATNQSPPWVLD